MGLLPRPGDTGRIIDGLHIIADGHVNYYIYSKGERSIAVDSGFGKSAVELAKLGVDVAKVTHLFLTHSDRDHTGGLGLFKNAKLYISSEERRIISGETPRFLWFVKNSLKTDRPVNFLQDGDVIDADGIKVQSIGTPGHTPGSMSYLIDDTILCTGDALILKDGTARPSPSFLNKDNTAARESIRKLAMVASAKIVCTGHSGYSTDTGGAFKPWRETT